MPDLTAVTAIIGSVKTATEIAKLLKDSNLSFEKAEMKLKLADLISALADAKTELAEIQHVISEKEGKIKELEEALEVKNKMCYEKPYYMMINDDNKKEGPFCPQCYDSKGLRVRLQDYKNGYWTCPTCKNGFEDSTFNRQGPEGIDRGPSYY